MWEFCNGRWLCLSPKGEFAQCLVSTGESEVVRMVCMLCYSQIFPPVGKNLRPWLQMFLFPLTLELTSVNCLLRSFSISHSNLQNFRGRKGRDSWGIYPAMNHQSFWGAWGQNASHSVLRGCAVGGWRPEPSQPGCWLKDQLCHLLVMWPWASYLTFS